MNCFKKILIVQYRMNEYLELNYYNDTHDKQPVEFINLRHASVLDPDVPYNTALVRFSVDSHEVPIFIPHIQEPVNDMFLKPNPLFSQTTTSITKTTTSAIDEANSGTSILFSHSIPFEYTGATNTYVDLAPMFDGYAENFGYTYLPTTAKMVRVKEFNNNAVYHDILFASDQFTKYFANTTKIRADLEETAELVNGTLYIMEVYLEYYNSTVIVGGGGGTTTFVGYGGFYVFQNFTVPGGVAIFDDETLQVIKDGAVETTLPIHPYGTDLGMANYAQLRYNSGKVELIISYNFKTPGSREFVFSASINKHQNTFEKYQSRYIGFDTIPTLADYNAYVGSNTAIAQTEKEIAKHELNTDMQVAVEYSHNDDGVYHWNGEYIKWQPENNFLRKPPPPHTRLSVCQNQYFHSHSLKHFSKLISQAITRLFKYFGNGWSNFPTVLSDKEVEIEPVDAKLGLLIPWEMFGNSKWRIVVNGRLKRYFGFHTVPHETWQDAHVLVFDLGTLPKTALGYGTGGSLIMYGAIIEQFRSSCMFPFRSIVFKATGFNVNSLKKYTNSLFSTLDAQATQNMGELIVTDLLLNVQDLNSFYDKLTYTAQCYDRKISLVSSELSNIRVKVYLETNDGISIPLLLPVNASASIMMQFTPA